MRVIKRHTGTTEHGKEYAVVVAKTSKSILPAQHTSYHKVRSGVFAKPILTESKKAWHLRRWINHFFRLSK
jgi:hypothetical protein